MEVYYEGTEITSYVQVRSCVSRDVCGGRCDALEIEFENAAGWYRWGPQEDDRLLVAHNGYDTGIMYLNTILPEEGRFRVLATSLPCKARAKAYKSFIGKSIEEIMRMCAATSGMEYQIFGIDKNTVIPYIQQEGESCAAFLHRLLKLEGATLKCVNGKYTAIGIEYAQNLEPQQALEISVQQSGAEYKRSGRKLRRLTLETPYASATAEDADVPDGHASLTINSAPARDDIQAGRWARGLLLHANRACESLRIDSEFNPGFACMARVNVDGSTDANGEWLIEEAEHDFVNMTSTATLHKCIASIS